MADELPPLDPSTSRALDAERRRPDVDDAMSDRLLGRVMASVAVGAAMTAAAKAAAASTAKTAGSATAAAAGTTAKMLPWIIAAFVVGGGTGAALHAALTSPPAPPSPTVVTVTPPPVPTAPTTPATSAVPAISVGELPSAKVDGPKPGPAPSGALDSQASGRDVDLAAERALVDRARTALTRGQSSAALEALDAHAKSYPRGRLAEEREALAVDALARAGRSDEARARADRFRTIYPNSVFGGVVDGASPPR